jgi:hypothetical protein
MFGMLFKTDRVFSRKKVFKEVILLERQYNATSEDSFHKFTLNVPRFLWDAVKDRTSWGSEYNHTVSKYLIDLMKNDCFGVQERPATPEKVKEIEKRGQVFYPDPPHKWHGFQFILGRNSYKLQAWRKNKEKYLDRTPVNGRIN